MNHNLWWYANFEIETIKTKSLFVISFLASFILCFCTKITLEIFIIDIWVERTCFLVTIVEVKTLRKLLSVTILTWNHKKWRTYLAFRISFAHFHTIYWAVLTKFICIVYFMDSKSPIFIPLILWKTGPRLDAEIFGFKILFF